MSGTPDSVWEASDGSWRLEANCLGADTELFFLHQGGQARELITGWCVGCPVQVPCREQGKVDGWYYGVFGGMSANQRQRYDSSGVLPAPPPGCEWVWDAEHQGWQLVFKVSHGRDEG